MNQTTSVPVVSVIVPMYNVEMYLRECLDSVVNQTLKNIEIICVDDGSPDRSGEIADEYAEKYGNVRVVRKANGGLSSARNAGLDVASGRYVYFLDSDDFLDLETLSELSSKADEEELDIVYFNTVSFFENKEVREKNLNYLSYYNRKGDYSGVYTGQQMFAKMRENKEFFGSACLVMLRRSLLEENGIRFYNGIIHEDNLFTFQCAMLASRVGYIDKAYYHRRVHGDSIMTTRKSMRNVEGYVVSYAEMLSFLHNREVDESAAKCISEYLYYSMYRNACTIYRGLDAEGKKQEMAHGDFCAQHLLDLVKKNVAYEVDNEKLRQKIKQLENDAKAAVSSRRKRKMGYLPGKIKGGIQCVRDHGLRYTIHLAIKKCTNKLPRISCDNKLLKWISWPFRKVGNILNTMRKYGVTYHFRAYSVKAAMKTQRDTPFVSVIMPVYNAADFLEQGLDTLKNQTLKNIEVICVDDGSTDNSLEILRRYAAEDSRFKVLQQKNKFAGAARNLGLSQAKGEFVVFLDSDDFFAKSLCEEAYCAGKAHKADVVLFAAKHFDNATGRFKEAKWLLQAQKAPVKQPFNYRNCPETLYQISSPAPWTKLFRRAFVEKAGLQFQPLHNSNDLFFTYSALAMAERIVTLDRPLVFYRVGLETNLQTKKKKYPFCFCEAYQAWHDKLKELGILETVKKSYVNIALSGCLHNLRTNADLEVKRQVFDKLKNEVLESLEISGHKESFYLVNKNYKDMLLILNGSFEEYMETLAQNEFAGAHKSIVTGKGRNEMKQPIISVIMPVYNAQQYLEETVKSLQEQTFSDYEVIFVDDASTDASLTILDRTAQTDPRFRVLQQKEGGAGAARNLGFSYARGEYSIFLDSDDLFSPVLLEKLYAAITETQADIAACNFSRIYPDGRETQQEGVHTKWIPDGHEVFSYRDTPDYIMRVINPTPWNKLYRTDFIREKGLRFDEISSTNDIAFAAVSVAAAERVTYISDSLVRYRVGHAGTITSSKKGKLNNVKTAVFSAVKQARELPHSDMINNAILSFVVDNFVYSLSQYVKDFSDPDAAAFYQMVHETFNREEFDNVDPRTLHNSKQYLEFCTVRKHDYETMKKLISRRLIVSLTTYPKRIGLIPQVLESLYEQTRTPDEIVLWLAPEQFPEREKELPERLVELSGQGKLTIRWCDDLKAHKKYFFAMQEYPEDLIVTVDDDLTYSPDTLSALYDSYLLYPDAVSTVRAHLMVLDEDHQILPYLSWIQETDACIHEPSMQLMATGGAGVLYPPHLFRKEFFDPQAIMENSPYADDLWLKAMQLASEVPVVVARPHEQLRYIPDSQEEALYLINVRQNQNDVQLKNIMQWMDRTLEPGLFMRGLTESTVGTRILGVERVTKHIDKERKVLRGKFALADGKVRQLNTGIRLADKRKMDEAAKRQIAEKNLRKVREELQKTQDDRKLLEAQLVQNKQQRDNLQQQLAQTRTQLRETQESKPIGRQLKAAGTALAQQRSAGANPVALGFKYLVYGLAWIPAKLLAGMIFYLKNGGKQTLKKLLGRVSGKK